MLAFKMHKFEILSDRDNMMLLDGNHLEKKLISNKKLPLTLTDILFPCQQGLFFFFHCPSKLKTIPLAFQTHFVKAC